MIKKLLPGLLALLLIAGISSDAFAQKKNRRGKPTPKKEIPKDTLKKDEKASKKGGIKPYDKVITKDAKFFL